MFARAKLASLLFDVVVLEVSGLGTPADHRTPQGVHGGSRGQTAVRWAASRASGNAGAVAEFDQLLRDLGAVRCSWAGAVADRPGNPSDEDIEALVGRCAASDLAPDLTVARRLNATLIAPVDAAALEGATVMSARALVAPDVSSLSWSEVGRMRELETLRVLRRLLGELLELGVEESAAAAADAFDTLSADVEELLWRQLGPRHRASQQALVLRLMLPDETPPSWSSLVGELQAL